MTDSSLAARRLAELLEWDAGATSLWRDEDFGQVLAHQLSAPLDEDLPGATKGIQWLPWPQRRTSITTFGDLLNDPVPSLALLEQTKQFAKSQMSRAALGMPTQVASVIYYACIAAAMVRLHKRITTLDDAALRTGLDWVCRLPWIDRSIEGLCRSALLTVAATMS
jgi:hypothetical protein